MLLASSVDQHWNTTNTFSHTFLHAVISAYRTCFTPELSSKINFLNLYFCRHDLFRLLLHGLRLWPLQFAIFFIGAIWARNFELLSVKNNIKKISNPSSTITFSWFCSTLLETNNKQPLQSWYCNSFSLNSEEKEFQVWLMKWINEENSVGFSHRLVVQFGLQLFVVSNFPNCLHEIFLNNIIPLSSDGKETSFCANVSQISSIKWIWQLHDCFII